MTKISRVSAGVPTGGQFAGNNRPESDAELQALMEFNDISSEMLEAPHPQGGYDEIQTSPSGYVGYLLEGRPHNAAGPAIDYGRVEDPDGRHQTSWLNGQRLDAPDPDLRFTGMVEDENGVAHQTWSWGGNTEVTVSPTGRTVWKHDGDVDRAGAPAITGGGLPDVWMRHDRRIPNPFPATPTATPRQSDTGEYIEYQGEKYESGATNIERAKRIRDDLRGAIHAGALGVNAGLFARAQVNIVGKPGVEGKPQTISVVYRPETLSMTALYRRGFDGGKELTDAGREITQTLSDIANAHNTWNSGPGAPEGRGAFEVRVDVE